MVMENPEPIHAVALVVNPASGGGGNDHLQLAITRMLREQGIWVAAFATHPLRGARPAVEAALAAGFAEIWGVGGDGTIQQALAPIVEAGAVLGPIPGGTSNRLVAVIGATEHHGLEQARWMLRQPVTTIDLGACNGELFTVRAGIGVGALAARLTERDKRGMGNLAYIFAGVKAARQTEPRQVWLRAEGRTVYEGSMWGAIVTNLPFVVPLKAPGIDRATPTDGRVHVTIIPERPDLSRIWQWLKRRRADTPTDPAVVQYDGPRCQLEADGAVEVHLDGEILGAVRAVEVECRPRALRVRGLKIAAGT